MNGTEKSDSQPLSSALRAEVLLDQLESDDPPADRDAVLSRVKEILQQTRETDSGEPIVDFLTARYEVQAGRHSDAIVALRKFLDTREGKNEWRAHLLLGDLFVNEYPQLARNSYRKAQMLKPDEPNILLGLSRCAAQLGRPEDALALAREAVDRRATIESLTHLSRQFINRREWSEAQSAAKRALDLAKGRAEQMEDEVVRSVPSRRDLILLDQQYRLLVEVLQRWIADTKSVKPEVYVELADMVQEQAQAANRLSLFEAVRILEQGVRDSGAQVPPALMESYARSLARIGRRDDAIVEFKRLRDLDPRNRAAQEWLEKLGASTNP